MRHAKFISVSDLAASALSSLSPSSLALNSCIIETVTLVLGAPRSGTTWLAKILDSHPDVLYRHEPDELHRPVAGLSPRRQIETWLAERRPRAAGKRPFFPKSWMPPSLAAVRNAIAWSVHGAGRLPGVGRAISHVNLPDFLDQHQAERVHGVIKLVGWDATTVARALPRSRSLFILRHPCGQVASVMKGAAHGRFGSSGADSEAPFDFDRAALFAKARGVPEAAFHSLPDAAKYAWCWIAFNEPVLGRVNGMSNVRLVLYEDLCSRPEPLARELLRFVGLPWHDQTARFIQGSTHHAGRSAKDYYAVLRSSTATADRWRTTMPEPDQEAVRSVARRSRLAAYWPDLAA